MISYAKKQQTSDLSESLLLNFIHFYYFTIKDFLLLTTSKITAARRTIPLTTFWIFWSIP